MSEGRKCQRFLVRLKREGGREVNNDGIEVFEAASLCVGAVCFECGVSPGSRLSPRSCSSLWSYQYR